jgi:glutamine--tRNA ligase
MKNGEFKDGELTLRAKIDMSSPNIYMRDPVIYRIAHSSHHRTGDKWCIYPMYDYAHPLEDAIEGITHSLCTLEFEEHRPFYDWVVKETEFAMPPKQIEFARLELTNMIMSKRYLKRLVDERKVDGWDDPRMSTISGLRRRGYTPESIRNFAESIGISKSNSVVDIAMLEHAVREDLKLKATRKMAVLNPLKLVITNYPEDKIEYLDAENNSENEELGSRKVPFSREIYIEADDFMENPPKKYYRFFVGNEVRLRNAYFVKCTDVIKDENGKVIEIHGTYDEETKSGTGFTGRKVKGTIHWVSAKENVKATVRLYDYLFKLNEETGQYEYNEDSITVLKDCIMEKSFETAQKGERFQFNRHGYFSVDVKDTKEDELVFNQIVGLKDNFNKK